MTPRPSVYLAGPITGESYADAINWRIVVKTKLGQAKIDTASPMRHKEVLKDDQNLAAYYDTKEATDPLITNGGILMRDSFDVRRCDMVFAYLRGAKTASIGTVSEIAWAWLLRKPIVVVMEKGNVHEHGFILAMAPIIVETLEEGIGVVKRILT